MRRFFAFLLLGSPLLIKGSIVTDVANAQCKYTQSLMVSVLQDGMTSDNSRKLRKLNMDSLQMASKHCQSEHFGFIPAAAETYLSPNELVIESVNQHFVDYLRAAYEPEKLDSLRSAFFDLVKAMKDASEQPSLAKLDPQLGDPDDLSGDDSSVLDNNHYSSDYQCKNAQWLIASIIEDGITDQNSKRLDNLDYDKLAEATESCHPRFLGLLPKFESLYESENNLYLEYDHVKDPFVDYLQIVHHKPGNLHARRTAFLNLVKAIKDSYGDEIVVSTRDIPEMYNINSDDQMTVSFLRKNKTTILKVMSFLNDVVQSNQEGNPGIHAALNQACTLFAPNEMKLAVKLVPQLVNVACAVGDAL